MAGRISCGMLQIREFFSGWRLISFKTGNRKLAVEEEKNDLRKKRMICGKEIRI